MLSRTVVEYWATREGWPNDRLSAKRATEFAQRIQVLEREAVQKDAALEAARRSGEGWEVKHNRLLGALQALLDGKVR